MEYENEKATFISENISVKKYRNCFEKTVINELKRVKLNFGKTAIFRILFCLLLLFIIIISCTFYMFNRIFKLLYNMAIYLSRSSYN